MALSTTAASSPGRTLCRPLPPLSLCLRFPLDLPPPAVAGPRPPHPLLVRPPPMPLPVGGAAPLCGMAQYDAAVVGRRMYVMEGWRWPFYASPRVGVYDVDRDVWDEMSEGMQDGWTGASAVVGDCLIIVNDYGDGWVKAYDAGCDAWRGVEGGGVPPVLKRPYAVSGADGEIYVVGSGLKVRVGTVIVEATGEEEGRKERPRMQWEVVKGPPAFADRSSPPRRISAPSLAIPLRPSRLPPPVPPTPVPASTAPTAIVGLSPASTVGPFSPAPTLPSSSQSASPGSACPLSLPSQLAALSPSLAAHFSLVSQLPPPP